MSSQPKWCTWWCSLCVKCHANACPSIWGGQPEVPCGHNP